MNQNSTFRKQDKLNLLIFLLFRRFKRKFSHRKITLLKNWSLEKISFVFIKFILGS